MSVAYPAEQLQRFLQVLKVVSKEATVLAEVRGRLGRAVPVTADWVSALKDSPQQADLVESFAAKFGRMQDTTGDNFAGALNRTNELADDLFATYRGVWRYCADTLRVDAGLLPPMLQITI